MGSNGICWDLLGSAGIHWHLLVDLSVDPSADPSVDSSVDPPVDPSMDPPVDPPVDPSVDLLGGFWWMFGKALDSQGFGVLGCFLRPLGSTVSRGICLGPPHPVTPSISTTKSPQPWSLREPRRTSSNDYK